MIGHQKVHDFCVEHFNEPVIFGFEVVRLIGYGETAVDCYYIARHAHGGRLVWHTAVGPCMTLRALKEQDVVIPSAPSYEGEVWNNFKRLDDWLAMNGAPREGKFILDLRPDDHEGHRFDAPLESSNGRTSVSKTENSGSNPGSFAILE
jgi:hypothetical protein